MKKQFPELGPTEKRCELLHWLLEKKYSNTMICQVLEPLDGKTQEERERLAREILQKLKAEKP